jgi:hypothetical protein
LAQITPRLPGCSALRWMKRCAELAGACAVKGGVLGGRGQGGADHVPTNSRPRHTSPAPGSDDSCYRYSRSPYPPTEPGPLKPPAAAPRSAPSPRSRH